MAQEFDIFDPRTMFRLIERMPPVNTFFRSTLFNNAHTFVTEHVDVDFKKGNRALAPFVHPKIGTKNVPNSGYRTKTYTPPIVAPNKTTNAGDLAKRLAGESIYSGRTPADRAVQKLAEDFKQLKEMIARREEWMCAQAIFTGKIPIIGDGLNEEIDFNFTNFEAKATAAPKWKTNKLGFINEKKKIVQKTGFVNPDILILADDVLEDFLADEKVQKMLDVKDYSLAHVDPRQLPHGVTFIGTLKKEGIDIFTYNEWYLDDWHTPKTPVDMPMVPAGYIALLSTQAEYSINYGAVTLIDDITRKWRTVEAALVPHDWIKHGPDRHFIGLDSHPLPVPHEVDSWYIAQVL